MSGALNRAMEKFGWRGYEGDSEFEEEYYEEPEETYEEAETVTPMPRPEIVSSQPEETDLRRIVPVHPASYNDAYVIGESFRDGVPVIINLTGLSDLEARRIVDYASGLVHGLRGDIEQVTSRVFLLAPQSVRVETKSMEQHTGNPIFK